MVIEVTDTNISDVINNDKLTILQFSAPWCGPCRTLSPIIDELSNNNEDITIGKINVDENANTAVSYGIRGIPAIIFLKNGEILEKIVGAKSKTELQEKIDHFKS